MAKQGLLLLRKRPKNLLALVVENPSAKAEDIRDVGFIPGLERFIGGGNGNQFQYSCLENSVDRRAW